MYPKIFEVGYSPTWKKYVRRKYIFGLRKYYLDILISHFWRTFKRANVMLSMPVILTLFSNQYHSYCIMITFVASILYKCNNGSNKCINNWGEDFYAYKLRIPQDQSYVVL